MDNRIVMIFPSSSAASQAKRVLLNMNLEFPIYEAVMNEALAIAKDRINEGTKVIVCRGGTASYLRKNLDIPIVDVEFSYFDFAYSVKKALEYSSKIALMGFSTSFEVVKKVRGMLWEDITIVHLKNKEELEENVRALAEAGIEVLIGGISVVTMGNKYGLRTVMIDVIDEDLIKEAVEQAIHSLKIQLEREEKFETINSILNCASEGIIGIDKNGNIFNINNVAKHILEINDDKIQDKNISDIIPFSNLMETVYTGKKIFGELFEVGRYSIALNSLPISVENEIIGAVITIQQVKHIQILEQKIRNKLHAKGHIARKTFEDIIGVSRTINTVKEKAKRFAKVDSTVLISGETGTGKEIFAQSIHSYSPRSKNPFVAINCAALPQNILESELFGYVRGAFTGAKAEGKVGIFELAHTGTIFLDEISEISPEVQARLLRVIQEKEVTRIGDDKVIPVDVRVLAASNKDLLEEIKQGKFREDLYYRLCVLVLELPPLRERREDILELVKYFIREKGGKFSRHIKEITPGALDVLTSMEWPGNIRQLGNIVERIIVICDGEVIDENIVREATNTFIKADIQQEVKEKAISKSNESNDSGILSKVEIELIVKVLEDCGGNKTEAAKKLGISTTTLWRKIKQIKNAGKDFFDHGNYKL